MAAHVGQPTSSRANEKPHRYTAICETVPDRPYFRAYHMRHTQRQTQNCPTGGRTTEALCLSGASISRYTIQRILTRTSLSLLLLKRYRCKTAGTRTPHNGPGSSAAQASAHPAPAPESPPPPLEPSGEAVP